MLGSEFKYVLAIDCETSGIVSKSLNPGCNNNERAQAVAWGVCVVEFATLDIAEELYVEIQPLEGMMWSSRAEAVHGLSKQYLKQHGKQELESALDIAELIIKYWGADTPVIVLGHNVWFDKCFLDEMFKRYGIGVVSLIV